MIRHNKLTLDHEEIEASREVLLSGFLAQGKGVSDFEARICNFFGLPTSNAVALSSGTSSLYISLVVLGAKNKNVAIPAYSCSSLRHALKLAGAKEILIDVEKNTPNIDIEQLNNSKAEIAIIPHMYGIPAKIGTIRKDIKIIEDCAQSIGAHINNTKVGLFGDITVLSFYATKLMTSGGQGGMIISKNKSYIEKARDYREFDCRRDKKERFNFQMTDLQASIGLVQLKKLPKFLEIRENIYKRYKNEKWNLLDTTVSSHVPVRYRAVLNHEDPGRAIKYLGASGISCIIPIEEWEILGPLEKFKNACYLSRNSLSIPLYPSLGEKQIDKIVKEINKIL